MRRPAVASAASLLFVLLPLASAWAQGTPQTPVSKPPATKPTAAQPAAPKPKYSMVAVRAAFVVDFESMSAKNTFHAVTGSSHVSAIGGTADIVFFGHLFARTLVDHASLTGVRGEFVGSSFVPNGIHESISMTPVEFGAGWRFAPGAPKRAPAPQPGRPSTAARPPAPSKPRSITPYLGGGLLGLHYSEISAVLDTENTRTTFRGVMVFGGLDLKLGQRFTAGVEAEYRSIANALTGASSAGADAGESNLGGFVIRGLVGLRFGKF